MMIFQDGVVVGRRVPSDLLFSTYKAESGPPQTARIPIFYSPPTTL